MTPLWEKALRASALAHVSFGLGDYDGTANRAYYAMFDAARALLRKRQGLTADVTKRHSTTIEQFSLFYAKAGLIDKELGRAFRSAFDARAKADYADSSIDKTAAIALLADMDAFLAAVAPLLAESPAP